MPVGVWRRDCRCGGRAYGTAPQPPQERCRFCGQQLVDPPVLVLARFVPRAGAALLLDSQRRREAQQALDAYYRRLERKPDTTIVATARGAVSSVLNAFPVDRRPGAAVCSFCGYDRLPPRFLWLRCPRPHCGGTLLPDALEPQPHQALTIGASA